MFLANCCSRTDKLFIIRVTEVYYYFLFCFFLFFFYVREEERINDLFLRWNDWKMTTNRNLLS